ncbi:hypothetical protein ACSVIJ_05085 [Pseudomonas sp. NCHU5208]|uniref:hypothetical protein n=1 Tax=unclassified Pseudomonas TaxID=196821 RepID=UPI003F9CFED7
MTRSNECIHTLLQDCRTFVEQACTSDQAGSEKAPLVLAQIDEILNAPADEQHQPASASVQFTFRHPVSGETATVAMSLKEIQENLSSELYDKLAEQVCSCEPVGETNVVDCNCGDHVDEYKLLPEPTIAAGPERLRNRYGIDGDYFGKNLARTIRDFDSFTPDELARHLFRLGMVADSSVLTEQEFAGWAAVALEFLNSLLWDEVGVDTLDKLRAGQGTNTDSGRLWLAALDFVENTPRTAPLPFQSRVRTWMLECFGMHIAADRNERNHRFLEEALEYVQSCGCTESEALKLMRYVFGRPVGEQAQELGGVMVTLAALASAHDLNMHRAGEAELARIQQPEVMERIRQKQLSKPAMSPLPGVYPDRVPFPPAAHSEHHQ